MGFPASRVFSRLEILLWRSDGEWSRGRTVRSRARETRRGSSPFESRLENFAGELSPLRFFCAGSEGRAPLRVCGDIQQTPNDGSQRGDLPREIFAPGLEGRPSFPREIFRPGCARSPSGSATRRQGAESLHLVKAIQGSRFQIGNNRGPRQRLGGADEYHL
jgi:hypothetical protein